MTDRLNRSSLRRFAATALLVAVGLSVAALAVRTWFVVASGPYAATSGFEEFCLYNIWKAAHGFILYEWPQQPPYLLTSYNEGFYRIYAGWVHLWNATDARLVAVSRAFTLLWAFLAAALQIWLVRRIVPRVAWSLAWAAGLAFLFWFGSTFNPWMPVTTRPDPAAVALSLGGLVCVLVALERDETWRWLLATICFFAAWSFKQSVVWIFAGVVLFELLSRRRWSRVLLLVVPFSMLCAVAIWRGGDVYRYNMFEVPVIYQWSSRQSVLILARLAALNLFFAVFGGGALVRLLREWRSVRTEASDVERDQVAVAIIAVPTVVFGTAQLALHGSSVNNILEGAALLVVLATATWLKEWRRPDASTSLLVGGVLLLFIAPVPMLHLMQAARGIPETEIHRVSLGNATKLNSVQLAQRRDFADWMRTVPKPIWINDAMLQMPWFATDGKYPAYPFDFQFDADATQKHVYVGGGFGSLIRQRRFAALLLRPQYDAGFIRAARAAGYIEAPVPARFSHLPTEYGLERVGPVLFLRPITSLSE